MPDANQPDANQPDANRPGTNWPAPTVTAPIKATVALPGSKSITNRALILAALANGPSTLTGVLRSRDTDLMLTALTTLGVGIAFPANEKTSDASQPNSATTVTVTPAPLRGGTIDCGLAGTIMRFLPPVAALATGTTVMDGDVQARTRPQSTILDALRSLGVDVSGSTLPFTIHGTGSVTGGEVVIDASGSSQFVSGLLLSASRFEKGLTISHSGGRLPSLPHIEMTVKMLTQSGVTVRQPDPSTWIVEPGPINAIPWAIEPDLSNAAAFLAAAAATGGTVSIPLWPQHTTQPGAHIVEILEAIGCTVEHKADGVLTIVGNRQLAGLTANLGDIGELTPTIAALCALATTPSHLTGIGHLRGHETDRLKALTTEINRLGGNCTETSDGLSIIPAPLTGGNWHCYADHRMATAGALIGLVTPGVELDDVHSTSKTLPNFVSLWTSMIAGQ